MADDVVKEIEKLEEPYSADGYNGRGSRPFTILKGTTNVLVSIPHCVNHFRTGNVKKADIFTGALGMYLHSHTGCSLIIAEHLGETDPNFDPFDSNSYQQELSRFVKENDVKVVLDLHGSARDKPYAVDLGTLDADDSSLCGYGFIKDFMIYAFEYFLRDISDVDTGIYSNRVFSGSGQKTVTNVISHTNGVPCVQVEINRNFRDPDMPVHLNAFVEALTYIVNGFSFVNWAAEGITASKVGQSDTHKPLEKLEFLEDSKPYTTDDLVTICSNQSKVHSVHTRALAERGYEERYAHDPAGYVLLTNRMIALLFSKKAEEVIGRPVVVYKTPMNLHLIGVPMADKVDRVYLSTKLYDRVKGSSATSRVMIRSPFTNSRMYIDIEGTDYEDKGRVNVNGVSAEKVMMPRYFKQIMGLTDRPLDRIDVNLFERLLREASPYDKELIHRCYRRVEDENYCVLRDTGTREERERVAELLEAKGAYSMVEVVVVPKDKEESRSREGFRLRDRIAARLVGEAEFYLSASWSNEVDDRNMVARVSPNLMSLLGVENNDKVVVCYNGRSGIVRILAEQSLQDYQISLPSPLRKKLRMNDVNEVVTVKRSAHYTFSRHSQMQTLAVLGVVLAVFEITHDYLVGFLASAVMTPVIVYLLLNEERVKVK